MLKAEILTIETTDDSLTGIGTCVVWKLICQHHRIHSCSITGTLTGSRASAPLPAKVVVYTGPGEVGSGRRFNGCAESGGLSNGTGSGVWQVSPQVAEVDGTGAGGGGVDDGVGVDSFSGVGIGCCYRNA